VGNTGKSLHHLAANGSVLRAAADVWALGQLVLGTLIDKWHHTTWAVPSRRWLITRSENTGSGVAVVADDTVIPSRLDEADCAGGPIEFKPTAAAITGADTA